MTDAKRQDAPTDDVPAGEAPTGLQRRSLLAGAAGVALGLGLKPESAAALILGNEDPRSWAVSTDPNIYAQAFARRFTNYFINALDRDVLGFGAVYRPDPGHSNRYTVGAAQEWQYVLGIPGVATKIWGYHNHESGPTFPGRTFEVRRGVPTTVRWINELADGNGPLPHILPVDQTITMQSPTTGVPLATHHHGGDTAAAYDGGPTAWATPYRAEIGPAIAGDNSLGQLATDVPALSFTYANLSEASLHWYHDHADTITRINVGAGLAGMYVLRDDNEDRLLSANLIPKAPYEMALVIQDRNFDEWGQLSYTAKAADYPEPLNPNFPQNRPTHMPEMFGDIICVNGQAWPVAEVEARAYRLRLLNGSDSRFYTLNFGSRTRVYQIGTDLGLLDKGVKLDSLTIAPGERVDLVVDFSAYAGWLSQWYQPPVNVDVTNSAATPFPDGDPPVGGATLVMRFRVAKPLAWGTPNPSAMLLPNTNLRPVHGPLPATPAVVNKTRGILLAEGVDTYGRITPLLGVYDPTGVNNIGTLAMYDPITETPAEFSTEIWEFYNASVDSHPVHMHLVRFRILDRQDFTATLTATVMSTGWEGVRMEPGATMTGPAVPPAAHEAGWKDTVQCPPGQVTRVVATFPRKGRYVYHCHILSHEEHNMMRFYEVV